MAKDNLVFLKQFFVEFQNTGAFCRSSQRAAKALTVPLRAEREPVRILELGPGTGAITKRILADMIPGDSLTECEINPHFMDALKAKLEHNPDFMKHRERVSFFLGAAQDLPEEFKYDVIICCLPFLNFEIQTVREIFNKIRSLSKPTTVMTYFEYFGIRDIGKFLSPRLRDINAFLTDVYRQQRIRQERVWLNFLPMNIHTLRVAA